MKKIFATLLIVACALTTVVFAAIQTFNGTGKYIMSEFETEDIARQRAIQKAQQDAQDKAGVYLTSFSKTENARLTADEISAVTNNIINVSDVQVESEPFEVNGEPGIIWTVTLKATIDPEGIWDFVKRDDKDKVTIVQQNNTLREDFAKNDEQVEDLKEQYKRAASQAERDKIREQMKQADRDFLANQKLEEALKLRYEGFTKGLMDGNLEGMKANFHNEIKLYDEILELGEYFEAYYNRGTAYNRLNQYERAIQDFDKAIQLNPNYAQAYESRGTAYNRLNQYESAIQDFNRAIELNPNLDDVYGRRGKAYQILGQNERAIADLDKAIDFMWNNDSFLKNARENENILSMKSTDLTELYFARGLAYSDLKQYEQAIQDFNKAIEYGVVKQVAAAYNVRGFIYGRLKQYERAIQDFDKVVELNPNYAQAYFLRGGAYIELKQYERAIQDFDKVVELKPDFVDAYFYRGEAYIELKQYERAIQNFDKVVELKPDFVDAYFYRGGAYIELKQYERAIQDFDKAIQLNPNYAESYSYRGFAYQKLKQYEKAIQDYNKALTFIEHPALYCNRGEAYYRLKNYKQAFADLTKALELGVDGKDLGEVLYYRGLCYQATGDEAKAQADFAKARELGYSE